MEIKPYRILLTLQQFPTDVSMLLKRFKGFIFCFILGLLLYSNNVKAQYEGFPISASPCPTIGSGYETYLYLSTAEYGYDYHWYKGTDYYSGTYIGTTNMYTGGIGADIDISAYGTGQYVCYATLEGYYPDPVNFFYGSAVITITDHNVTTPSISASSTQICNGNPVTLYSSIPETVWYLNGSYIGYGSAIQASAEGTYKGSALYCEIYSDFSNEIYISIPSLPPAPTVYADAYTICSGGGTYLRASTGSNISWYREDGLFMGSGNAVWVTGGGRYRAYDINSCGGPGGFSQPGGPIDIMEITVPPAPSVSADATSFCSGSGTTLHASGSGIYWYRDGVHIGYGNDIWVTSAGSYFAYATNECGWSGVSSAIGISVGFAPGPPSVSADATFFCNGSGTYLHASGPDIYWFRDGVHIGYGNDIWITTAGSYYAYATNGCGWSSASSTIEISVGFAPSPPSVSADATFFCNGSGTYLHASGPDIYWFRDGVHIGYGNDIWVNTAGSYYAYATNGCGWSSASSFIGISVGYVASAPSITAGSTLLCNGATTTLTASGAGTMYWYLNKSTYLGVGSSISVSGAGTYNAYAGNSCGGSGWSNDVNISTTSTPSVPSVSADAPFFCSGSGTTLHASGPGIYWYRDGVHIGYGNDIWVTTAGNYYAYATNSCAWSGASSGIGITVGYPPAAPSGVSASASSLGCSDGAGTITVSAGSPSGATLTYALQGYTGYQVSNIFTAAPGTYTVLVKATNNCGETVSSTTVSVVANPIPAIPVNLSVNVTQPGCGQVSGAINVSAYSPSGGTIYYHIQSLTGEQTGTSFSGISPGIYTLYARSMSTTGCYSGWAGSAFTVNSPPSPPPSAPSISASGSTLLCNGATVTLASTGSGVVWSNGQTGNSITVSAEGNYTATASNSCGTSGSSNTIAVTIGATPSAPSISAEGSTLLCNGATVTLTATGSGVVWSNGQTGNNITVSTAGNYAATASNDCGTSVASNTIVITTGSTPPAPVITAAGSTLLCNGANLLLSSTGSGIQWYKDGTIIPAATGSYYNTSASGSYTAYSTNSCGTSSESNIIAITASETPEEPVVSAVGPTLLCNGASVILSSTGSNIQWYRNGVIISGSTSATYTTTVAGGYTTRSTNSCGTSAASNTVAVTTSITPAAPVVVANGNTTFCTGGSVNLTATGSGIQWYSNAIAIPGATGTTYAATSTGNYTATSANTCGVSLPSSAISITVHSGVPEMPVITAVGSTTFCTGGSVILSTAGSAIQWYKDGLAIPGATANNYTASASGNYTATAGNSCGVSPVSSPLAVITEPGIPSAPVVTASGSTTICDGASVTLSANTSADWFRNGYPVGNGSTFSASLKGTYTAKTSNSCGVSLVSNTITVTVNPMLRVKTSRFDQVMPGASNQPVPDTTALFNESKALLTEHINTVSEGMADDWMDRLAPGLENYSQEVKDTLRVKLIEISAAGSDMSHPFGASVLLPGKVSASGYNSFAEAMKDILSLNTFTATINPWLLSSPYPYAPMMQATEKYLTNTDSALCSRLQQLQSEQVASQPGVTFYQYLINQYGGAMNLTAAQLDMLLKSCTSCNYILEKDLPLPVFIESGAKGCITASEYNAAIASLYNEFAGGLPDTSVNYELMVSTYLNHKWGFTLGYDKYKDFADQLLTNSSAILCNQPVYASIESDPYAEVKNMIATAAANGKRDYAAYISEERRKFVQAYIDTCSAAKAAVDLTKEEQVYHYTLYYYDQADNLVRTIPPEGVSFLADNELAYVANYRKGTPPVCDNYDGPASDSDKAIALQKLSDVLAADTARAIEMWLYNPDNASGQVLATTPDKKYLYQACINGSQMNVDLYTLQPDTVANTIDIILSNHATADLTGITPLPPWTHVVVQSDSLRAGNMQVFVNGVLRPLRFGNPGPVKSGCGWEISDPQVMPENLAVLKHLRFYDRLMSTDEIAANAANACFNLDPGYKPQLQSSLLAWYRFNTPEAGGPTTIAANSTRESSFAPVYPAHTLATTYAYNSTNQVMMQHTPDGGTSRFWYDNLSRLTASQNAKQREEDKYSYTKYDMLGRITEVGEKAYAGSGLTEPNYLDSTAVNIFLAGGSNSQITQTLYDSIPVPENGIHAVQQENLRKRVVASIYRETDSSLVKQASYYNYDLNGNVKTLYQSVHGLGIKTLDYEYDLVSGKVNFVRYQSGHPDQFYYQYKYDAENRLTEAWSGTKALVKPFGSSYLMDGKLDASYEYYLHGPLARMELGDQYGKVQGMDYAYTLQGWLKGVNGQKLDAAKEIGEDGEFIAKDALAYSLGYYKGDYKPIGGTNSSAFGMQYKGLPGDITGQDLFNGNISNTTVAISKFRNGDPVGYTYKYDQLNRLKEMRQHELAGSATTWNAGSSVDKYKESISYDGNGNILSFLRNGTTEDGKPLAMDNLTYSYRKDENNRLLNNRLRHVNDEVSSSNYAEDIDDQDNNNYGYDAIGNLTQDKQEGIDSIEWTVYGKIKSISKTNGTSITYNYDPSGNRVSKSVFTPSQGNLMTWYVRDAQGNTMGVYDNWNCGINWKEQQLYGSSRLGMWEPNINLNTVTDSSLAVWDTIGKKGYELNNHLGNVLAVISDKRTLNSSGVYEADVISAQDYYPFGMVQSGRRFGSDNYRYGFNGKENDNEVKGMRNSVDFGERIYDPRLGRFLSIDPFTSKFASITPYQYAANSPIGYIDKEGGFAVEVHYQIAYRAALKAGFSKEIADKIAYMASTYADHPDPKILGMKMMGMRINGGKHLQYGRFGVFYGQGGTSSSQLDDPEHATWHSMRSTLDTKRGMSKVQAKARGMAYGWDKIISAAHSGNFEDLGQGVHALQDADAHVGSSMEEHLGLNSDGSYTFSAKTMLFNDLFGDTHDADRWSEIGLTVFGLLQGDKEVVKKATNGNGDIVLDLYTTSSKNQKKIMSALEKKGYRNIKIHESPWKPEKD